MVPYRLERLGVVMRPDPAAAFEAGLRALTRDGPSVRLSA